MNPPIDIRHTAAPPIATPAMPPALKVDEDAGLVAAEVCALEDSVLDDTGDDVDVAIIEGENVAAVTTLVEATAELIPLGTRSTYA